jgi:NADH-quinone oxidoreductase subunit G
LADPVVTSHHGVTPTHEPGDTVTFTLNGAPATAQAGEFLIAAAERAGTYIPRFCYHPRMKPVGMCRMCLVEVSGPRGPSLQPACYIPVTDGMEVDTTSERVRKAQDGVLEFLLINHPLDCPVCDKGGECPLQDQAMSYGPGESRFVEEKRHWAKPIPISELVLLDRERCIQCGRCVRFALEVAGEAQIDFLDRGDALEVNVFEDHPFTSYFSGNTVQICPVGALTAVPYRFKARPWDLDQVESTCTTCALGCRVAVQSSANRVTRLIGVDSDAVNQSWLCDKGRFGFEAVNSDDRLVEPLVRRSRDDELTPASWTEALALVAERLGALLRQGGAEQVGVIGGARLANEDAYAWARLAKGVIGTDSVDAQLGDGLPAEFVLALPRATLDDACAARRVVVLSGDVREELPVLFLRLRAAVEDGPAAVVELSPSTTALTPYAASVRYRPGELGATVDALVAGATDPPGVADPDGWAGARAVLADAGDGSDVVVVLGRPSLAEDGALVAEAATALATAWPRARFLPALRRGNVLGALDMGLAPGVLPGRVGLEEGRAWFQAAWGSVPVGRGRDTGEMLRALAEGSMGALVLLGADPLGDFPDRHLAEEALERSPFTVAVDTFLSPSTARADVILPAAMLQERTGTTTNVEGRITRLGQKLVAPGQCWPDWMIAADLAARLGTDFAVGNPADLWDEIERLSPAHAGITRQVLDSDAGRSGVVAPLRAAVVPRPRRLVPFDPMATPGIDAVDRQGAQPLAGLAEPRGEESGPLEGARTSADGDGARGDGVVVDGAESPPAAGRPPILAWPVPVTPRALPPADRYSLRLVAPRRLYDSGVLLEMSGSLTALAGTPEVRVNPADLERLGLGTGSAVRVRSARGSLVLDAVAADDVPRGVVEIPFNLVDGAGGGAGTLIDVGQPVVDVRLETL